MSIDPIAPTLPPTLEPATIPINAPPAADAAPPRLLDASSLWWSDADYPPTSPELMPWRWAAPRSPRIGLSIALLVGALVFTPCAIGCWLLGRDELHQMDDGFVPDDHRGWFRFVRAWGGVWTLVGVAAILGLLFVLAG